MIHVERKEKADAVTYTVDREIGPAEQSTYIEVPFRMPEKTEELEVRYEVTSRSPDRRAIIDLGVKDAKRVRGWSGGARDSFRLGTEKATPGYLAGPLAPGDGWAVLLGAYRVPEDGCRVRVTIECRLMKPRWLKGDLHVHSVHSDGKYTLEETVRIMEHMGCDFVALTDHNAVSQNFAYPRNCDIVIIPGMEWTTNFGHCNMLGVPDPLDDFRVAGMDDVRRRLATARERGAKIVLNHPHCPNCGWLWDFDVDHDWVEVWNGPWSEANRKTLDWWQAQLVAGRRLTATGGSDKHRPHPLHTHAMPATFVYSEAKTAEAILRAIGEGRVFVSYAVDGPTMELRLGDYRMGDLVPADVAASEEAVFTAERVAAGDTVRLISDRGVERETTVASGERIELEIDIRGRKFIRAEIWRYFPVVDATWMAAMSNPLYIEHGV